MSPPRPFEPPSPVPVVLGSENVFQESIKSE